MIKKKPVPRNDELRTCKKCGKTKDVEDFYNFTAWDWKTYTCKECERERCRRCNYKYRDKINPDEAEEIRSRIKLCEICGGDQRLNVDHCHTTSKIRGVLCNKCNQALGLFKDNPDNLLKAIKYLNDKESKNRAQCLREENI